MSSRDFGIGARKCLAAQDAGEVIISEGSGQVLEISGGKVTGMNFFLDFLDPVRLFPSFGLPLHVDG